MADTTDTTSTEDTGPKWTNRRMMAWVALISTLSVTAWLMGPWLEVERLKALESVITWFYTAMASVIASYMGFTTWATIAKK